MNQPNEYENEWIKYNWKWVSIVKMKRINKMKMNEWTENEWKSIKLPFAIVIKYETDINGRGFNFLYNPCFREEEEEVTDDSDDEKEESNTKDGDEKKENGR